MLTKSASYESLVYLCFDAVAQEAGLQMKGIVFNLLQEVVVRHFGEEAWDRLVEQAGTSGAYTSLGNYKDDELIALVESASQALSMPGDEVLRWFGREAMTELSNKYPQFFAGHLDTRSFVLSVNQIIHPEVRKLYAGASCPHFGFQELPGGGLAMGYRSPRRMCSLAEGFVEGASHHFGECVDFRHVLCMHRGDDHCSFEIRWSERVTCSAA